jgi:predicted tellurium resistance membrane protein TerC
LRRHAAAARSTVAAAAETAAAATSTATEATAAAAIIGKPTAAAAEPVTTAELRRTPILERIKRFFAESIPLVASPAATTSIVTHLTHVPSLRPHPTPGAMDEKRRTANGGDPPALSPLAYSLKRALCEHFHVPRRHRRTRLAFRSLATAAMLRQNPPMDLISLAADPSAWFALLTLIVLEVVLGIDNLVFIAILSNKLPKSQQTRARRIGLALALIMRIALLMLIGWLVTLTQPIVDLGLQGAPDAHGELSFETAFSGRDLILLAGGLFLLWKATKEIHHNMDPEETSGELLDKDMGVAQIGLTAAIAQIIALDLVFSVDSILTAVGMTDQIPIMVAAVVITVGIMLFAADPLAKFIDKNPTLVMLALAFLVMIGLVLIADGFGFHVPKGYIYVAMVFSVAVELLNMASRNRRKRANEGKARP